MQNTVTEKCDEEATESTSDANQVSKSNNYVEEATEIAEIKTAESLNLREIHPYSSAEPDSAIHGEGLFVAALPARNRVDPCFRLCADQIPMWHTDCLKVGSLFENNSVFIKKRKSGSISLIYEEQLRSRGVHGYSFSILAGNMSPADGVGFVFANRVPCSKNIKRLWSVFVNRTGKITKRMGETLIRLNNCHLPPLAINQRFSMIIDLNLFRATFEVTCSSIVLSRAHIDLSDIAEKVDASCGYFCAAIAQADMVVRLTSAPMSIMSLPEVKYVHPASTDYDRTSSEYKGRANNSITNSNNLSMQMRDSNKPNNYNNWTKSNHFAFKRSDLSKKQNFYCNNNESYSYQDSQYNSKNDCFFKPNQPQWMYSWNDTHNPVQDDLSHHLISNSLNHLNQHYNTKKTPYNFTGDALFSYTDSDALNQMASGHNSGNLMFKETSYPPMPPFVEKNYLQSSTVPIQKEQSNDSFWNDVVNSTNISDSFAKNYFTTDNLFDQNQESHLSNTNQLMNLFQNASRLNNTNKNNKIDTAQNENHNAGHSYYYSQQPPFNNIWHDPDVLNNHFGLLSSESERESNYETTGIANKRVDTRKESILTENLSLEQKSVEQPSSLPRDILGSFKQSSDKKSQDNLDQEPTDLSVAPEVYFEDSYNLLLGNRTVSAPSAPSGAI